MRQRRPLSDAHFAALAIGTLVQVFSTGSASLANRSSEASATSKGMLPKRNAVFSSKPPMTERRRASRAALQKGWASATHHRAAEPESPQPPCNAPRVSCWQAPTRNDMDAESTLVRHPGACFFYLFHHSSNNQYDFR
jgi:hypothetical protein